MKAEILLEIIKFISGLNAGDDDLTAQLLKSTINAAPKTENRQWQDWDDGLMDEIRKLCDPLMKELDYEW